MFKKLASLNNYSTWSYYLTNHIRGQLPRNGYGSRLVYLEMHRLFERTDLKDNHKHIYINLSNVAKDCENYTTGKGVYNVNNIIYDKNNIEEIKKELFLDMVDVDKKIYNEVAPLPFKMTCYLNENYFKCKELLGFNHNKHYDWDNTYLQIFMKKTFK